MVRLTPAQHKAWAAVAEAPGLSVREAAARLAVAHSTASYHLRVLERHGLLEAVRAGRELRHYPAGTTRDARLAALLGDARKRLLLAALARPDAAGRSLNQAAHQAGLPFGAAKRAVEELAGLGLVRLERRGFRYQIRATGELRGLAR